MQIRIVDNQWIHLDNIFPEFEDAIDRHFQATHPRKRYIVDTRKQQWDGVYRKYMRKGQKLRLPFLYELLALCAERNIPADIVDLRSPSPAPDPDEPPLRAAAHHWPMRVPTHAQSSRAAHQSTPLVANQPTTTAN